jgi:hypothetical protein
MVCDKKDIHQPWFDRSQLKGRLEARIVVVAVAVVAIVAAVAMVAFVLHELVRLVGVLLTLVKVNHKTSH